MDSLNLVDSYQGCLVAKRSRIKAVLLGKLQIPKTSEELEEKSEEGRRMMESADLNELAFTELILSIDVSHSSGKIAFGILKSCKTKDHEDGNATHAWEKLKKKFDPVSAPTLVKTERMFRESKLGEEGLHNYTTISEEITVGNGNKMLAKKVGSLRCIVQQKNGEKFVVVLKDVKFVPELWVNLFSISKALKNGFNLGNEDAVMKLMKENTTLYFNRMLKTKNGFVSGIKLLPILGNNIATTAVEANKVKPKINIKSLHKILCHCGEVCNQDDWKKLWI
jgi:hypothetical protein